MTLYLVPVFPTGVGMNRSSALCFSAHSGVPHGRGDEPFVSVEAVLVGDVFPTGVGMNR